MFIRMTRGWVRSHIRMLGVMEVKRYSVNSISHFLFLAPPCFNAFTRRPASECCSPPVAELFYLRCCLRFRLQCRTTPIAAAATTTTKKRKKNKKNKMLRPSRAWKGLLHRPLQVEN